VAVGADVVLTLWTSDPGLAARADAAGVDRVGIDLDRIGKADRQRGLRTWISQHREDDLHGVRKALTRAALFARTNPPHPGTHDEIDRLLGKGVDVLMLPMFRDAAEVERFVEWVDGRATVVLLLETLEAVEQVERIAALDGVGEVHVGINDLALALGLRNRFELLFSPIMDRVSAAVCASGARFGFGGIGRVGATDLPVPADLLYAQYARLRARAALISRAFLEPDPVDLGEEVRRSRARLRWWFERPPADIDRATVALRERVHAIATW
jgi:hypothetical protein